MTEDTKAVAAAFDGLSHGYAASFIDNELAADARRRAHMVYARSFHAPALIADVGCGPGQDSVWLARHGFQVLAVDCSPSMIAMARQAVDQAGVGSAVITWQGDGFAPGRLPEIAGQLLDGVLLGFGPLNFVSDLEQALRNIRAAMRPGGVAVVSALSSRCAWDLMWHLATGRGIAPRWHRSPQTVRISDVDCPISYWSARQLIHAANRFFHLLNVTAVGSIAPPPYADPLMDRLPTARRTLCRWDERLQQTRLAAAIADMLWLELRAR
ncbi:class I SAM-dependent methyltransferase [Actinomadura terrae]|uniref:class I SAM-dependent methyltransferase n=1 Tax=Actinomadura terrae TaxID=604353 RepID=UPI001FA773F5|nr:class I SAM-dependent methyltransferase [Actinomadura terrae]